MIDDDNDDQAETNLRPAIDDTDDTDLDVEARESDTLADFPRDPLPADVMPQPRIVSFHIEGQLVEIPSFTAWVRSMGFDHTKLTGQQLDNLLGLHLSRWLALTFEE